MQIQGAKEEVQLQTDLLADIAPHLDAIEAQGIAGSIGLAEVRATKLLVLDAEVALQRAERRLLETEEELRTDFQLSFSQVAPLVKAFAVRRTDYVPEIAAEASLPVRVIDQRIIAEREDLNALSFESYPRIDGVVESTVFDLADYETEYQMVGRIEVSFPLYDGGANKARVQEKSWRVSELQSQREAEIRSYRQRFAQSQLTLNRRLTEMDTIRAQLVDVEERYRSLMALVGNSLVSRREIIELIISKTQTQIELRQFYWQQEFNHVGINFLADNLLPIFGMQLGENAC